MMRGLSGMNNPVEGDGMMKALDYAGFIASQESRKSRQETRHKLEIEAEKQEHRWARQHRPHGW